MEQALRRDYGFLMKSRHFAVVGICRGCAEAIDEPASATATRSG
jgi:hypothetical protein